MLQRPFALRLLAPTVLVSLVLVIACLLAAVLLNYLTESVSRVLNENVRSTTAARELEQSIATLINFLRGDHPLSEASLNQINEQNQGVMSQLSDAKSLANLEQEKTLVIQVENGLKDYLGKWKTRSELPAVAKAELDRHLAAELDRQALQPCKELHRYNQTQIEKSDRAIQAIVTDMQWGLLAVGLGAPLAGLALGYTIARRLRHSIYQLSVGIRDAAGRLNRQLGSVTLEEETDLPELHERMQGVVREIELVIDQLQQRDREVLRAEQLVAVGQVAAGVAHELRNPLTSIKMLVQTGLEGEPARGLPMEDLAIVEHEIRRMENYIQTFLDFARPPHAERRRADLLDVLRRSLALVDGRARRQRVEIETDFPSDPVVLMIDPEQIQQVAVNLLLNAFDALPRGGRVRITVRPPSWGAAVGVAESAGMHVQQKSGEWVTVEIRDTGIGIPSRIEHRLFEPFVSSKETGVGLGLSISRRLIEAHGGSIAGGNLAEGGASFRFVLPLESSRAA